MQMDFVLNLVQVLQILSALGMVGLILMQHGKGADMGAAFGSGASGSLFGATGGANFLSRSTAVMATVFLASTLALAYFGFSVRSAPPASGSVLERAAITAPASTEPAASSEVPTSTAADAIPVDVAPASDTTDVPAPVGDALSPEAGAGQIPGE